MSNMVDFDSGKLFVGGISRDTTEFHLKDYFSKYGEISFSTIAKDRMSGTPRGFGFVNFADPSSSHRALSDHHEILGKTVEVKKAVPRGEQQQFQLSSTSPSSENQIRAKKIFVGGLSANLTEEEFKGYFEKFGRITDVVVMHDNMTNRPRGFGFITFDSEDAVEEILKTNFHELGGKFAEVKRAIPKDPIKMRGRASDGYWQDGFFPDNFQYGFYGNPDYMYPYGYSAGYQMPGYDCAGFAMPMFATVSPWNSFQMSRYGPLPYVSAPVYHMNGVFGAVSVGANNGVGDTVVNGNSNRVGGS